MRFLFVLLLLCAPASAAPIELDEDIPNGILAVEALIEHFDSQDVIIRTEPWFQTLPAFVAYAEAVATFGACAVDPLTLALEDKNPQVRVAAAVALEAIGPASIKAKPLLIEMLQSDDDRTNILACGIIRGIGPEAGELTDLLIAQLSNENFHVQYWACRALGGIGSNAAPAVGRLCVLLEDGVASVRRNAAIALGDITICFGPKSPDDIIQALEKATTDWSHCVNVAAHEALLKIKNRQKNPLECPRVVEPNDHRAILILPRKRLFDVSKNMLLRVTIEGRALPDIVYNGEAMWIGIVPTTDLNDSKIRVPQWRINEWRSQLVDYPEEILKRWVNPVLVSDGIVNLNEGDIVTVQVYHSDTSEQDPRPLTDEFRLEVRAPLHPKEFPQDIKIDMPRY